MHSQIALWGAAFSLPDSGWALVVMAGALTALVVGINVLTLLRRQRAYALPGFESFSPSSVLWIAGLVGGFLYWGYLVAPRLSLDADRTLNTSSKELLEVTSQEDLLLPENENLPSWLTNQPHLDNETVIIVVHSPQMTTSEEAEVAVMEQVRTLIRKDFRRFHPGEQSWSVPEEIIHKVAITRRYIEKTEIDFGGSTGVRPMYQAFAQLELSPALRQEMLPFWRKSVVQERAGILLHLMLLLGLALASITLVLRNETKHHNRHRAQWKLTAAGVTLGSILLSAFLLK